MKKFLFENLRILFVLLLGGVALSAFSQTSTLTGKVTDNTGTSIIGANVIIVGTSSGTVTDINGNYTLELISSEVEITVSFIGYLSETFSITAAEGSNPTRNITLIEDLLQLDDIIVIGYGTMKKSDLTGAVASVSSDDINSTTTTNIEQALVGRAAGVRVTTTTGAPGANTSVLIRGVTSINNSSAMWVVDGVPADPNSINSNDVESIEILKDAATTAIYGAAGGNGVVMVTTKKGQAGKTQATLNITQGWQSVPDSRMIDLANGPEYAQMYTEYQLLKRTRPDDMFFSDNESVPTYDYQKEVFRTGLVQDYYLGVTGGNDKSNFSIGLGYAAQEGVLRNSDYSKFTARINSDHKLNKWLSVGERVSVTNETRGGFEEWEYLNEYNSPILMAQQYQPFVPVYVDSLGNAATEKNEYTNWSASPIGNITNPVSRIENTNKERENLGVKATVYAKIEPIKGLQFESRISGDISYGNAYNFTPTYNVSGSNRSLVSSIYRGFNNYKGWQWQNYATYSNSLFNAHNFTVMAGYEAAESASLDMSATREDLINEEPEMWYFNASLNDTLVAQLPNGGGWERSSYGYFGRFSYDYKGIVLGQFNIRKDFDSRFGPKHRSGSFLSYSVGLKFTEFNAVRNAIPFLNFGKIRWSAGEIGNNPLGDYSFYSTVSTQQVYDYSFNNSGTHSLGAARNTIANPEIHWEAVVTQNLGIDLAFLQNRLSLTAEWFQRANDGMIMRVEVPGHAGWIVRDSYQEGGEAAPYVNVGEMVNKGFEFQTGWKDTKGKFNYSASFNYTYVTTIAQNIPDTIYDGQITGVDGNLAWTVPNGALSEYFGLKVERLFRPEDYDDNLGMITNQPYIEDPETGARIYAQPDAMPGDFKFVDRNGDNKIDDQDVGPIGNPIPKHVFGLNLSTSYGWFDLNIFLQGATGFKVFNAQKIYQFNTDGSWNWSSEYVNNHYREDIYNRDDELIFPANTTAEYPRIDLTNANGNFTSISDFYMEDGAYLRINNLSLGVTLPSELTQKISIQSLRAFVGVQNLYTITAYKGYDPEIGSESLTVQGLDKGTYPKPRLFRVGLNIKF